MLRFPSPVLERRTLLLTKHALSAKGARRVPKMIQPVEKVDVGPLGSQKGARNKAKTLRKRRFQPLLQRLKSA